MQNKYNLTMEQNIFLAKKISRQYLCKCKDGRDKYNISIHL